MKALAAALGPLLLLTACAHGTTTTATTTASNASVTAPVATAAPGGGSNAVHDGRASNVPAPTAAQPKAAMQAGSSSGATARPHPAVKRVARTAVKRAPAPVMPQILGASVSPVVVGSGTTVSATVRTTPGVVSVVAYAGGASMAVPRVGPGLFQGSTTLPPLPPFAHGSYPVTFVARDARGASTQSAVGVTVR